MTVLVSHGKIWPQMKDIGLLRLYLNQILNYLSYVSHLFVVKSQIATLWVTQLIQFYRILSKTVSILNSRTNKGIIMFYMSNKIPHIDD